ncbi:MAG: hypothetical protein IMZ64_08990 [Bacteroidetes bacterium]|nr:hypothetical protein [Bacteroidota bacterium]
MEEEVVFDYPELEGLGPDEVFVEKVHVVKGINRQKIMIKQTIKRSDIGTMEQILKEEHNADDIYLTTIEK